jgi:hypothetical protein
MKRSFHKTLLALIVVFVPPFFLVFTEEGNRVSDSVLLWLFDRPAVKLDLKQASAEYTESELKQVYPKLQWKCGRVDSEFGQTACNATIGTFNELPAQRLLAFFANGRLNAIELAYLPRYHQALLRQLLKSLGQPQNAASATGDSPRTDPVLQWSTGRGLVILKKTLKPDDQAMLLWLASAR